ncbi:MAG: hypothetical protein R2761_23625 [Acidimicrobiales bacterium]
MSVRSALESSLPSLSALSPADGAAVELARAYADAIDRDPDELVKLGPKLLDVLGSLLMTPKARAAVATGAPELPEGNPIDALRERRAERNGKAAA